MRQKFIPNVQVFLVNNLINMIEIVYLWLKSDSESYHKLTYENSMLGAFSCNVTVVANDVIMQRTQQCLGLYETHQLNLYIVIWLKVVKIHQHAKFQAIPSMCSPANAWKPLRTDMPQNHHGWSDGLTDPCTGGKRVFQALDRRADGRTDSPKT